MTDSKLLIPFLDLQKVNKSYREKFSALFVDFLNSGVYIKGGYVAAFEEKYAEYCGSKYCVGVGNGLDALTLILKGYITLGKVNEGDEVIVAANTFIATILAIVNAGLKPVLAEPDKKTFNLDENIVKSHINSKTKVILPTHLYGQLAPMLKINELAKQKDLLVVCDAAQAHGAINEMGDNVGCLCDATAFSFYPTKNLGALGDGGAVTTDDKELESVIRSLGNYGTTSKNNNDFIGINSRLDALQAAFLIEKLKELDADNIKRRNIATRYVSEIKNPKIELPYWDGTNNHVFYAFVVRVKNRIEFCNYLKRNHIGYLIHYPTPPYEQNALKKFFNTSFPVTEQMHKEVVSIPLNISLNNLDIEQIIKIINEY